MGIGVSIFLIAVGAILAFAVEASLSGLDLETVGVILMIVGAIGLVASLIFWSSFSPYGRRREVVDRGVVREREIL
jgi:Zn-dependent protease with chaperone function